MSFFFFFLGGGESSIFRIEPVWQRGLANALRLESRLFLVEREIFSELNPQNVDNLFGGGGQQPRQTLMLRVPRVKLRTSNQ